MDESTYNSLLEDELEALFDEAEEYVSAEMEHYFDSGASRKQPTKIPLLENLDANPKGDFPITDSSRFNSKYWTSTGFRPDFGGRLLMNSDIRLGQFFKRCLVYYMIPGHSPYGQIKSWSTTVTFANGWIKAIEQYLLIPNGLDASEMAIKSISSKMINTALDVAEKSETKRHYEFLFYGIVFWISLSNDGYIPKSVSLEDVLLSRVDTLTRRRSVANVSFVNYKGWKPLTEDELSRLLTYAIDTIEKGLPILERVVSRLSAINAEEKPRLITSIDNDFNEYMNIFSETINGVPLVDVKVRNGHIEHKGNIYPQRSISWRRSYRNALTQIKNSLLIFVSLLTGMRVSELGQLEFDDLYYDSDTGSSFINITRFKTSSDPNYFGETETIAIPNFFTSISKRYFELREFVATDYGPLLFSSNTGNKTNLGKRHVQKSFFRLGIELGIDDLHPHRMRKTIAEILIKRSEKNIDIIRMLFGHRSYTMTLRYISRNPYMIGSVARLLESHYADNFTEIISSVINGEASGTFADKLTSTLGKKDRKLFQGKLIRMKVLEYIIYMMQSGNPIQIEQTTIGTFCVITQAITLNNLPPCLENKRFEVGIKPDLSSCDISCEHAVVLSKSIAAIEKNIRFYESILEQSVSLSKSAVLKIQKKLASNKKHLELLAHQNSPIVRSKTS